MVGLDEEDIQLILKHCNPNVVTHELSSTIYTIKDVSEGVYILGDHERTLQIEYDDISMKSKLILTRFDGTFGTLRFTEKTFFNSSLVLNHLGIMSLLMLFMQIAQLYILVIKFFI